MNKPIDVNILNDGSVLVLDEKQYKEVLSFLAGYYSHDYANSLLIKFAKMTGYVKNDDGDKYLTVIDNKENNNALLKY